MSIENSINPANISKTAILALHDLPPGDAYNALPSSLETLTFFAAYPTLKSCLGCFGCWVKTPTKCVIKDKGADFVGLLAKLSQLVIISRLVFGGLSPDVKTVIDRSIGFVMPFFRISNGESRHVRRIGNPFSSRYILYGQDITEAEKETAKKMAQANSLNLGSGQFTIEFHATALEAVRALI
ncbi:MAG: flavodoxin family protein [Deltaproteobacteria bacterium]|jgi:multimeric flavodoxin WrbA|nr:flavodoxin family protein [Deltaproteobacteria bacterium]